MSIEGRCADCTLVASTPRPRADTGSLLRRLPAALFNLTVAAIDKVADFLAGSLVGDNTVFGASAVPAFLAGDAPTETTVFGPLGATDDATPQYGLARVIVDEENQFIGGWQLGEEQQLGLGRLQETAFGVTAEAPGAVGADLDYTGSQFGIGRPSGFTDCCYWRLIQLMVFTPGPTLKKLLDVAELFTGVRPAATEEPLLITLTWPIPPGNDSYWPPPGAPDSDRDIYWDYRGQWWGPATPVSVELDLYWVSGDPTPIDKFWPASDPSELPAGMTLEKALQIVKPAGVVIRLRNAPPAGSSGCSGATQRGSWSTLWGRWTKGE